MKISELLSEVQELRRKGVKIVDLEKLEAALQATQATSSRDASWELKIAELKHQSEIAGYNAAQETSRKLFDATIAFGSAALKSSILINGGAAVAMLAYLGSANGTKSGEFAYSLLLFTAGVLSSAIATAVSYLCQYHYAQEEESKGHCFRWGAIILVIIVFISFGIGSHTAFLGFLNQK